jgi:hypothetical protein
MQLLFIDESYDQYTKNYFLLAGIVIPEYKWNECAKLLKTIKFNLKVQQNNEIKWSFIFANKNNPIAHILSTEERINLLVNPILNFIVEHKLQLFTTVTYLPELQIKYDKDKKYSPNMTIDFNTYLYHINYEAIVQRFQYYLQDQYKQGIKDKGIVICDHRSKVQDKALLKLHDTMLNDESCYPKVNYINLIEHVLLAPSHYSVGIQFADIVGGVIMSKLTDNPPTKGLLQKIWECFNVDTKTGQKQGRGYVTIPTDSSHWDERIKKRG